ncbi:MAG: hypothetical protein KTR26_05075 [Flammeovirgaceae bacterium]|nr:hypothetical protein [Flammeovirgaceae bacterium]
MGWSKLTKWFYKPLITVLTVFLFSYSQGIGQSNDPTTDWWFMDYSFIKYQDNFLQATSPKTLTHVFEKLIKLENTKDSRVNILHIGDSHIQADIFSGQVRDKFINDPRFPVNSRGFVFPYSVARTNNPYNYKSFGNGIWENKRSVKSKHFSKWGLAGISLETRDENASVSLHPNVGNHIYEIRKVKVFYPNNNPKSFDVVVAPVAGNSISSFFEGDGYVEYSFKKPQSSVEIQVSKNEDFQNELILQGVMLDNMAPGVVYSASGFNSADVGSYARCVDFEKNLEGISPDLVVISLGTNDAYMYNFNQVQFKSDLRSMINKIRRMVPECSIILTSPADNFRRRRYANKNNEKARNVMVELSREMDVAVWDLFHIMGGFQSMNTWYGKGLAQRDKLHFTSKGYKLQGELFYQAFDRTFQQYKEFKMMGGN